MVGTVGDLMEEFLESLKAIREHWRNLPTQPLYCSECGKFIDNVVDETQGFVGAYTMCEKCHSEFVVEMGHAIGRYDHN